MQKLMKIFHRLYTKWRYRINSMVRYRLLFLTSAPIFLTLLALIAMTFYWSLQYTWQSTLVDVTERLGVAKNSISIIKGQQTQNITSFANSYSFRTKLDSDNAAESNRNGDDISNIDSSDGVTDFALWVSNQADDNQLDFLAWYPVSSELDIDYYLSLSESDSFFDVLSSAEMERYNHNLAARAEVSIRDTDQIEQRGLVSRSIYTVQDTEGTIIGFLDGGLLLNNGTTLVDQIRDLIYPNLDFGKGTVTLFLDDLRISTNVPLNSDDNIGRALGTRVSNSVNTTVLQQGQLWSDKAYVYDAWYVSAYEPIHNHNNQIIGMIYTGYLVWPLIKTYLMNLVEMGAFILAVLLLSGFMVYRSARSLFKPIETIYRVVKLVQMGKDTRIGKLKLDDNHELAQLANQFDNMLDQLALRNHEIKQAAALLENKVADRTASLREKTEQLEHHIDLLNQTRDKLITSEKLAALGELTAGIAHEINNPTAVILGNVELMKIELGEESTRVEEEIDIMLQQIDRIRNITRSLLQYSRQGGIQDVVTWQHLSPLIEESTTLVKTGSKRKDIVFELNLNATNQVEINRHHCLQILVNLQMNAIHAMPEGGKLIVASRDWYENEQECGAIIDVIDEGHGIPAEKLQRIFDPFYTTKREGTGLGLSVSQSILNQIGGEIKVTSELGKGTHFSIYLPKKTGLDLAVENIS